MSGHSHWSTIKRDKAASDAKRSKVFSKLSRAITIAAREGGGGDIDSNAPLRLAVDKAREANMPKDNVQKAINKGLGVSSTGQAYEEVVYEGYGPNGVAFYVKALTDNKNRTVSEIRNIFSRYGGSLGAAGSTAYIFAEDPEVPSFSIELTEDDLENAQNLYDELDEHDDVQAVYSNFSTSENL